jgi:pyruvate/2-oxoglutarate dehydrogenase complex dihydrolipoamide dehydrogenase (E3) component
MANETIKADICVIGAGSGGLSVAAGAVQMGASTVLVEQGAMGGDCLNTGCVPSKALLAASHMAQAWTLSAPFGVHMQPPKIDQKGVRNHVRKTIEGIAPNDSVERFEALGVRVIQERGCFSAPQELTAGPYKISARRFVIATGSYAFVPPIDGIESVPYLTNETVFDLDDIPPHLIILGGGPIGIEMAQAHRGLGSEVTVLEMAQIMPKDDPELVEVVRKKLLEEGINLLEGVKVVSVAKSKSGVRVAVETGKGEKPNFVEGSHLLVAAGRRANVQDLGLEAAGIECTPAGIKVDKRLRTTNRRIFAIGDVVGGMQFTHVAGYHAGIVIRNALFRLPAKANLGAVPWVTYTSPELAQVGINEETAKEKGLSVRILRWPFSDNDRARTERKTDGLVKVVVSSKGHILGASIVGANAGELIQTWVLAMSGKLKIGAIASMVAPYPTLGEVNKRAAGSYYTPSLFSQRTKWIVRFLALFG